MARCSNVSLLGLFLLAASASATTVGPVKGAPVPGHPFAVNIPFAVDAPTDRACASAGVRYGSAPAPMVLHVQGQGLKRNLLVTSRARVDAQPVTVDVRVGCGAKAVTRKFVMATGVPAAKSPPQPEPVTRRAELAVRPRPKPVALMAPSEPLFPPPMPQEASVPKTEAPPTEELRQARSDAATAMAQLEAARKELAAVLDVERRTSQTLIDADHEIRDANSRVDRMRLVLKLIGAGLTLVAAGVVWLELHRMAVRRFRAPSEPEEPQMLEGAEVPT